MLSAAPWAGSAQSALNKVRPRHKKKKHRKDNRFVVRRCKVHSSVSFCRFSIFGLKDLSRVCPLKFALLIKIPAQGRNGIYGKLCVTPQTGGFKHERRNTFSESGAQSAPPIPIFGRPLGARLFRLNHALRDRLRG